MPAPNAEIVCRCGVGLAVAFKFTGALSLDGHTPFTSGNRTVG